MSDARAPIVRVLSVWANTCLAVFIVTRFESTPVVGSYVHLVVAAIFLLTAMRLTREDPAHYGVALGGLLEPSDDARGGDPLGLVDLARATIAATPSALTEIGVAIAVAAIVFPLYALGYAWWMEPAHGFALQLPPSFGSLVLAQLVVVALPEEAFFRGYVQTSLSDRTERRMRLLGVALEPSAWILQAFLFALVHVVVEPHPARLAVFFPGLLFGWVRAWRGGIGAAIALHAMSNLYSEILARSWL